MHKSIPEHMEDWVALLTQAELPVLGRSVAELADLQLRQDNITTQHIANVVLHDPLMTVKVLQYLQSHRTRRQSTDITTMAHALMMIGLEPFFVQFKAQATINTVLVEQPLALRGVLAVMNRAHHAALYARDWARVRHDLDPEEVMIAALLHDLAEILMWCFAPQLMLEISHLQQHDHSLRSESAQLHVLGFRLIDLQLAMVKAWHLPQLLHTLMDEHHASNPRVVNVALAAALARHSAHGWEDAAIPHDYAGICRLLSLPIHAAEERVAEVAYEAAREVDWYWLPPAVELPLTAPASPADPD